MAVYTQSEQAKRVPRILGALVVALMLILGAYFISNPNIFTPKTANAESTQQLLEAFAQQKGPDGRPLWEDELIATSSTTPTAGITDETDASTTNSDDAASNTLTDQFARNMFTQYMTQLGTTQPSDQDIDTFAENAITTLAQNHSQQESYSLQEEKVAGTGPAALTSYAVTAEQAIAANTVATDESEIDYFSDAVEKNDLAALKQVAAIGQAYTGLSSALIQTSVPTEAQYAQLEIANASSRLGEDITDMSTLETDPLRAYLGLSAYQTDAPALAKGFNDMATVYQNEDVTIPEGAPGYSFYSVLVTAGPTSTSTSDTASAESQ
jgi:hypothetical protein